jgi:hypothetical protein
MSADLLREAAEVLRERIADTEADGWMWGANDVEGWACDGGWVTEQDSRRAAYIATMHPGVGLALADWLDLAANGACCDECMTDPAADPLRAAALDTARLILGRAS